MLLSSTFNFWVKLSVCRWSNLKKRVALGKQRVGPRVQANGASISSDLKQFEQKFLGLRREFHTSECLCHDCEPSEARHIMDSLCRKLSELQTQARDLIELQELLGTNIFNFSQLKE